MAPNFGMYNLNNNGWTGFLQQGLNMFGGSMGGYNYGGSLFSNCYGEPNYGAVLGYQFANIAVGTADRIIADKKAAKGTQVNYSQEIENINKEIKTKQDAQGIIIDDINEEKTKFTKADEKLKTLSTDLTEATNTLNAAKEARNKYSGSSTDAQYVSLDKQVTEAEAEVKRINKEIEEQKTAKEAAEEQIKTKNEAIEQLKKEIQELQDKKAKYQEKVDKEILDDADRTKWQRASKKCLDETFNNDNPATERQFSRALYEFNTAKNDNDKRTYAQKAVEMYNSNNKLETANSSNKKAIEFLNKWLKEHPVEKQEQK